MKLQKVLSISLVLLFVFFGTASVFAGGGQSGAAGTAASQGAYVRDPNLNAPGVFPLNKTKVPLTIAVQQNPVIEDFETNWMTQQIEKNGNYDLTFQMFPAGELAQKIELMVMAGGADLPDVVWGAFGLGTLAKYGQAGMVVPTNNYYTTSAHFYNLNKGEIPLDNILQYVTSYDGNIYGLFQYWGQTSNEFSTTWLMIYEPWLQKLGIPMPTTTEEFRTVMRAFRDNDPNGNGIKDEIAITGEKATMLVNFMRALMNPFIYTQGNFLTLNNGKIDVVFNKPEWREGLRYARSLVEEGLVSPLAFTQDATQLTATISPNPPVVGTFARMSGSNLGMTDPKRVEYIIQQPLQGPSGLRQSTWVPVVPGINMIITKNCKTPEAAFVMGDYMYSEEMTVATRFGEKGVDWAVPGPEEKSVFDALGYPALIKPISPWGVLQNKWYAVTGPHMTPPKWANGQTATPLDHTVALGRSMTSTVEYANENPIFGLVFNEQEQAVIDEFQATINTYANEFYARFVMGDLSIDSDWNSYIAAFDRMGLQEVLAATQSAWDRMNK